jgi:F1F0 ATPase subunit 2
MKVALDMVCLAGGFAAGLLHFHLLHWNTRLFMTGGGPRAIAVQMLRLLALAGVLVGAALLGAMPLLAAAAGVMIARVLVVRHARSAP